MWFSIGLLMILTGLALMGFGLFLFYAWLPVLYALVGLDIGLLLGETLTGSVGAIAIALGIIGAVILGGASYFLEPYRRILLGISAGFLFGLSLAAAFGLDGLFGRFFGAALALVCGVIGAMFVTRFFDLFVVGASAIGGAAVVTKGIQLILWNLGVLDRAAGGALPTLLTIGLAIVGLFWQSQNISKWIQLASPPRNASNSVARGPSGSP
jgi:hypothetical protein